MQALQTKEPLVKLLLTVEEAAQILSVGRTLLYDLVMRGKVGSVKIGNARRIPVIALQAYIESLVQQQSR